MPDYFSNPSPAEVAEAIAYVTSTALSETVVWRSVSYTADGHGGVNRVFSDSTIPVWARNPVQRQASPTKSPGEAVYEWEFICRIADNIQPKDVFVYTGLALEVVEIIQRGTDSFSQLVYCKRVSS